jgi:hypothetical protein
MGAVVSLKERIAGSKRASAVERAWNVAKALEGRDQIEGLSWVEPTHDPKQGIRRKIDFSAEFPDDGTTPLYPVPMHITVGAPADKIVPDEDIQAIWTMPLLTRMGPAPESLDFKVQSSMGLGYGTNVSLRPTIDVVSFLPFPKADANEDEQFTPEFYVTLDLDTPVGVDEYLAAVAVYGGKVIQQFVSDDGFIAVKADPKTNTLFSAQMLMSMSAEELAETAADAGELEIFVYKVSKAAAKPVYDIKTILDGKKHEDIVDLPGVDSIIPSCYSGEDLGAGYKGGFHNPSLSVPSYLSLGGTTKGFGGSSFPPLSVHSSQPEPEALAISPEAAAKEVGNVKLGEGKRGAQAEYDTVTGLGYDAAFGVQPIRIQFVGVREASEAASQRKLETIAAN